MEADGSETAASATAGGATRGEGADAADGAAPHTAADVHMAEAGSSSAAGRATPQRTRAEDAVTPAHTRDTLHTRSVAGTAKRRQKRKSARFRTSSAADAALEAAVDEQSAKRARATSPSDKPHDDTEMT